VGDHVEGAKQRAARAVKRRLLLLWSGLPEAHKADHRPPDHLETLPHLLGRWRDLFRVCFRAFSRTGSFFLFLLQDSGLSKKKLRVLKTN
jgi:hypothetical protein